MLIANNTKLFVVTLGRLLNLGNELRERSYVDISLGGTQIEEAEIDVNRTEISSIDEIVGEANDDMLIDLTVGAFDADLADVGDLGVKSGNLARLRCHNPVLLGILLIWVVFSV